MLDFAEPLEMATSAPVDAGAPSAASVVTSDNTKQPTVVQISRLDDKTNTEAVKQQSDILVVTAAPMEAVTLPTVKEGQAAVTGTAPTAPKNGSKIPPGHKLIRKPKGDGTFSLFLRKMTPEELKTAAQTANSAPPAKPATTPLVASPVVLALAAAAPHVTASVPPLPSSVVLVKSEPPAPAPKPGSPAATSAPTPAPIAAVAKPGPSATKPGPPAANPVASTPLAAGAAGVLAGGAAVELVTKLPGLMEGLEKAIKHGMGIHSTLTGTALPTPPAAPAPAAATKPASAIAKASAAAAAAVPATAASSQVFTQFVALASGQVVPAPAAAQTVLVASPGAPGARALPIRTTTAPGAPGQATVRNPAASARAAALTTAGKASVPAPAGAAGSLAGAAPGVLSYGTQLATSGSSHAGGSSNAGHAGGVASKDNQSSGQDSNYGQTSDGQADQQDHGNGGDSTLR